MAQQGWLGRGRGRGSARDVRRLRPGHISVTSSHYSTPVPLHNEHGGTDEVPVLVLPEGKKNKEIADEIIYPTEFSPASEHLPVSCFEATDISPVEGPPSDTSPTFERPPNEPMIVSDPISTKGEAVQFPLPCTFDADFQSESEEIRFNSLDPSSALYKDIAQNFTSMLHPISATIKRIEQIQNSCLYQLYSLTKKHLRRKRSSEIARRKNAVLELKLYHGTTEGAVPHIVDGGFNRSYAGKFSGMKAYGAGVYFARDSKLSYGYAPPNGRKERRMFLCNVLMGLYTIGKATDVVPPVIDPNKSETDRYDSAVDNIDNPRIFVSCYRDNMAYPLYLITFV